MNEILLDYIRHQEEKIAEMKERLMLLQKSIPEIEKELEQDKQRWRKDNV